MTAQADSAASLPEASIESERRALRRHMRQQRRSMPQAQRRVAATQLAIQAERHRLLRPGKRIAVYLAMPEELSLTPLIARALRRGCQLYAPHIISTRRRTMCFVRLTAGASLQQHRWGVPQLRSPSRAIIAVQQLDLVLAPLVAFDANGNRLGMGAGFYDRSLSLVRRQRYWLRPRLIGIAYSLQQTPHIPALDHDLPLPAILTECGLIRTRRQRW